MIDALMIDVDGVLVHGRPDDGRPWASNLLNDLGLDPDLLQESFFARHWADVIIGKADLESALAPVLAQIAPHVSVNDLIAYWFAQDSRLDAKLLDELGALRASGLTIALATNQEHRRARYLLETLGLEMHVDLVHYSALMGVRKPEAAFFRQIERSNLFAADKIVLIDDTMANVEAARSAGWRAIHWTRQSSLSTELACLINPLSSGR